MGLISAAKVTSLRSEGGGSLLVSTAAFFSAALQAKTEKVIATQMVKRLFLVIISGSISR
jgi:hypothetical protein